MITKITKIAIKQPPLDKQKNKELKMNLFKSKLKERLQERVMKMQK